jgi:molecular chaperone GrpE
MSTKRKPEAEPLETESTDSVEEIRSQLKEATREKEESEKKSADYLNRLKRLQADMENLQKITKRQIETVTKQASEGLLLKLLPILDALQQAATIARGDSELPKEEIAVGLKMLLKQLTDVLRTEGLHEIPTVGHQLDPLKHEVVDSVERSGAPENMIVEEVRKGYLLKGKVIRPSLVIVSGPQTPKEEKTDRGSEEE